MLAVYEKCGSPVFYGPNYITSLAHNKYYSDFAFNSFLNAVNNRDTYSIDHPEFFTNENTDWYKSGKYFDEQIANEKLLSNKLITVKSGVAKGRLIGGNFDNFNLLYGTEYCPDVKNGDIRDVEAELLASKIIDTITDENIDNNDSISEIIPDIRNKISEGFKSTGKGLSKIASKIANKTDKQTDPIEEVEKFKELLDIGAITQEEFDAKKKELLNL